MSFVQSSITFVFIRVACIIEATIYGKNKKNLGKHKNTTGYLAFLFVFI
jgi:hypothetical protein